ncbi:hypothetical protein [Nonomuraea sp. NPDC049646]|uniref:hypothetical protein n=1 Tax=unclassified Nonomuraea TaxID=2593643 RepID=UPI00378E4318
MGCGCGKNRQQHEVVNADGNVVFTGTSEHTAKAVARRYPGSTVRPKGGAAPAEQQTTAAGDSPAVRGAESKPGA